MRAPRIIPTLVLLLACSLSPAVSWGQEAVPATPGVDIEMLNNRLQEAEASSDLDDASKATLLDLYRKSISLIEQRRGYEEANRRFTEARESAPRLAEPSAGQSRSLRTAMKASCGTSTEPTIFIRFLPAFCFSSSFRFRDTSPP